MYRNKIEELKKWKESKNRKPLIIRGARQVGKTYILKEFGKSNYEDVVYFNFDNDENLKSLFDYTKDPNRILEQLILASGKKIIPGKTLIFFDEIQECPNALNSLKYFCEDANEYHIVCAGSLLGIRLSHTSFPVGKVDFLNLYPMSFKEFLMADGGENLVEYMDSIHNIETIPSLFFSKLEEKLKAYQNKFHGNPDEFVFFIKHTSRTTARRILIEHIKISEVKKIKFHGLRHSMASRMINKGLNPLIVSKHLRHSSTQQTLDTYSHLFPNVTNGIMDEI